MIRSHLKATLTVAGLFILARVVACGGTSEGPSADGSTWTGTNASASSTTSHTSTPSHTPTLSTSSPTTTGSGEGGADAGSPPSTPCPGWPGWPGWENWDDFAPGCSFCVPTSKAALPPPIEWVACDPLLEMPTGCRQMKVDWPYDSTPFAYAPSVYVDPAGQAVLDFTRLSIPENWSMKIVAEADGPVRTAFLNYQIKQSQCAFFPENTVGAAQEKYAMSVIAGTNTISSFPEAVVGGSVDELHPKVQWIWDPSNGHGLAASDLVWATWNGSELGVARWGEPWKIVWSSAQAGGAGQYRATAWHDFVMWKSGDIYQHIMAWTPERGAYPLVAFPGDWTRGASAMGTDGQHLVWMEGEGKASPNDVAYAKESVMVAPFTTDPKLLAPKRLRSIPTTLPPISPWLVGCGYAATEYTTHRSLIVRLSDGRSWELKDPKPEAPLQQHGYFSTVFAVTCDEVFLQAGVGMAANIARVRLDALGPGMAPD